MKKKIRCELCPVIDFCPNTIPEYSMKQTSVNNPDDCPLYQMMMEHMEKHDKVGKALKKYWQDRN